MSTANLFAQEPWARRGEGEGRLAALEARLLVAETELDTLGQRGHASRTTSATTSGTTELTLLTIADVESTGVRRWKITYNVADVTHTTNGDVYVLRIRQDGTPVGSHTVRTPALGTGGRSFFTVYTPTAGTKSITATAQRISGTGTLTLVADVAGADSFLLVEDIGAA